MKLEKQTHPIFSANVATTQTAIAALSDSQFHQLGDELLRRLETRYRALRAHGLNTLGQSVIGQPDSYVGATAESCHIAVCYTTQRKGWWGKLADDVKTVRQNCPSVAEIVAVIARDVDREGPKRAKGQTTDSWLVAAKEAAGAAELRIIDRKEVAANLDASHQDLRLQYLHIPYSRLTSAGLLASAQLTTRQTIAAISQSGRFDKPRYVARTADRDLYKLWQSTFRGHRQEATDRTARKRLIPLVADSGLGKSSLVCRFAESLSSLLPVLLLQAKDIAFTDEDALVRHVVQKLQGVIDQQGRALEEAAIIKHFVGGIPCTLIVDGLDEVHDPEPVHRALNYWLGSPLGAVSTLILTSRPEFWRVCSDSSWKAHVPTIFRGKTDLWDVDSRPELLGVGICIPERFSENELEQAWTLAGFTQTDLYALSRESRDELTHPFTLRAYTDIANASGGKFEVVSRSQLLEEWLMRRLDTEVQPSKRITRDILLKALRILASAASQVPGGVLSVDLLSEVPRFDQTHPPGPVVECLISANLLESVPGKADHLRFSVEAVQDFCAAKSMWEEIQSAPVQIAEHFSTMRFTDASPKLAHLRPLLSGSESEQIFLRELTQRDAAMAAMVMQEGHEPWRKEARQCIASKLASDLNTRYFLQRAFAIEMLGRLGAEGANVIAAWLISVDESHRSLKYLAAVALYKIGHVPSAKFVFQWGPHWVSTDLDTYYYRETLGLARRCDDRFRDALIACAKSWLSEPSKSSKHARAVVTLACLNVDALVDHLRERLDQNGVLHLYENHALFALGAPRAAHLFLESALATTAAMEALGPEDKSEKRDSYYYSIHIHSADIRYLLTEHFIGVLRELLQSPISATAELGMELAIRSGAANLLGDVARTHARWKWIGGLEFPQSAVTPEGWLKMWAAADDDRARQYLLRCFPSYPTLEIEETLIQSLNSPPLQNGAAHALEHYGSQRALPALRSIIELHQRANPSRLIRNVVLALGGLRDETSILRLKELATDKEFRDANVAIRSLADIGTHEAETVLIEIFKSGISTKDAGAGLILCGRSSAVSVVMNHVRELPDGHIVLEEMLTRMSWHRGWRAGEYYMHIDEAPIIEYLAKFEPTSSKEQWDRIHAIERIDGPAVRNWLQRQVLKAGTQDDPILRESDKYALSTLCRGELELRDDACAIPNVLDDQVDHSDQTYSRVRLHLDHFSRAPVAQELRRRLSITQTVGTKRQLIKLLGLYGDATDASLLDEYLQSVDEPLSNMAYDSRMRLVDPLRVPEGW